MGKQHITLVYPGDLDTRTGGYRYDKRIAEELEQLDDDKRYEVERVSFTGDYPYPDAEQLEQANQRFATLEDNSLVLVDGLVFSAAPTVMAQHADRLKLIALIHHPLALETGLSKEQSDQLKASETKALSYATHVITTSKLTADSMADYHVNASSVTAILPGTDVAPLSSGSQSDTLQLLCVATLTPRKGHDVLLDALAQLTHLPWHLHCVGSTERHPDTYSKLLNQCQSRNLDGRISFAGELGDVELDKHYNEADAFVLASFHEGYGMVLTEAIARGLPIICTDGGAMKDTVPDGCGLLVKPGDAEALAEALNSYITDSALRNQLREAAITARSHLQSWRESAQQLSVQLNKLL